MMINNKKFVSGNYNSSLVDYLKKEINYDGSFLIYDNKYKVDSFTVCTPKDEFKNCEYINGYPHFEIPVFVCLNEINNFLNDEPLYDSDFAVRYGDVHPNKPNPMLGQLRNIYIGDAYSNLISTSGKVNDIFAIGDISEKSIMAFLKESNLDISKDDFVSEFLLSGNSKKDKSFLIEKYYEWCNNSLSQTINTLKKVGIDNDNYLMESDLYNNYDLLEQIKQFNFDDGLKSNGMIKYFLQEFMFILNSDLKDKIIVNVIGSDQSEHIKKVFKVINDNDIEVNLNFLTYGICKNSGSRNEEEWDELLTEIIYKNEFKILDDFIEPYDFLRYYFLSVSNDSIINFKSINNYKNNFIATILLSLELSKNCNKTTESIENSKLLCQMSLINQQLDCAITKGNISKFIKYLYDISIEYLNNQEKYSNISDIYFEFIYKCCCRLTLDKTNCFKKRLIKVR